MARTSTSTASRKPAKAVVIKAAERAAKKVAKEESAKVARKEAKKVAKKEGAKAALNPDYSVDLEEDTTGYEDEDLDEDDEEEIQFAPKKSLGLFSVSSRSEDDDEDEEEVEEEDETENDESIANQLDIFSFATQMLKSGRAVRLDIKRYGQFVTTKNKPYSLDLLQKEYGEGHYTIVVRDALKGTFIKQQSLSVEAPTEAKEAEVKARLEAQSEEKIDKIFNTFSQMTKDQQLQQSQILENLMEQQRIREEKEEARRERETELMREQTREKEGTLATILAAVLSKDKGSDNNMPLITMIQQQQSQTTQLIMESNKNFLTMMQEMRRDTNSMFEKMSEMNREQAREMQRQLESMAGKKTDGFDPMQMFQMLNDTREQGMSFGLKIQDLASAIAEKDSGTKEPKSLTETIIENLGKLAPVLLANASQGNSAQHQQYFDAPAPAPRPTQAPAQRQAIAPPKQEVKRTAVKPKVSVPAQKPDQKVEAKATNVKPTVAVNQEADKINADAELRQQVIELCTPLFSIAIQEGKTPVELANATVNAIISQGLNLQKSMSVLTYEELENLLFVKYGLPKQDEVVSYLREYYDNLTKAAASTH